MQFLPWSHNSVCSFNCFLKYSTLLAYRDLRISSMHVVAMVFANSINLLHTQYVTKICSTLPATLILVLKYTYIVVQISFEPLQTNASKCSGSIYNLQVVMMLSSFYVNSIVNQFVCILQRLLMFALIKQQNCQKGFMAIF